MKLKKEIEKLKKKQLAYLAKYHAKPGKRRAYCRGGGLEHYSIGSSSHRGVGAKGLN